MARHIFTPEESKRGGKSRASQPDFVEACKKGFQVTREEHPYFARFELPAKIQPTKKKKRGKR